MVEIGMTAIKVLSLFSGIGAFERALERLHIPYNLVAYCEIDKYAAKAFSLIHNISQEKNLVDVTKIDATKLPKDIDLLTYGFPCQDISTCGKEHGLEHEGQKTRSGLVWDAHHIINVTHPKIALCENVANLTKPKFAKEFKAILDNLESMGYNNYWQLMNSKNYGIPQHRERVFIISIRKDVDKGSFSFPSPIPLTKDLEDMLEDIVPSKYYVTEKSLHYILQTGHIKPVYVKPILNPKIASPLLATMHKVHKAGVDNFILREVTTQVSDAYRIYCSRYGVARTLKANAGGLGAKTGLYLNGKSPVRKLTPTECFRLMGFADKDVVLLHDAGISDTQLYKMAGNSIVVDVLMAIFKELYNV